MRNPQERRSVRGRPRVGLGRYGRTPFEVLGYALAWPLLHALARLPLAVLYRMSDGVVFLAYRVVRFRRRQTLENLRRALPRATAEEIEHYAEGSYRHMFDLAFEWLKLLSGDRAEIQSRVKLDVDVARQLVREGRSAIYVLGHCGNWEWAIPAATLGIPGLRLHVVYHPLSHPGFDGLFRRLREQWGSVLSPMSGTLRAMARLRREVTASVFVADQRPKRRGAHQVTRFFGRRTSFFQGPERIARRMDLPVVFVEVTREARGRYTMRTEWLCREPSETAEGEITEAFASRLEQQIEKDPGNWLWMHRRWREGPGEPESEPESVSEVRPDSG